MDPTIAAGLLPRRINLLLRRPRHCKHLRRSQSPLKYAFYSTRRNGFVIAVRTIGLCHSAPLPGRSGVRSKKKNRAVSYPPNNSSAATCTRAFLRNRHETGNGRSISKKALYSLLCYPVVAATVKRATTSMREDAQGPKMARVCRSDL
jgi:hypothetical protein